MRELRAELESLGHEVIIPFSAERQIPRKYWDDLKLANLERFAEEKGSTAKMYFDKIKEGDAILVFNPDKNGVKNYIGANTLMEIAIAFDLGRKVFVMHNLPDSNFHYELVMVRPVVLEGDLTKIM